MEYMQHQTPRALCLLAIALLAGCARTPGLLECQDTRAGICRRDKMNVALVTLSVDARAGSAMNSGRHMSWTERLQSLPIVGPLFLLPHYATVGVQGLTESQYAFENNLEPLNSENNVGLAVYLARRDRISDDQLKRYLAATCRTQFWKDGAVRQALAHDIVWHYTGEHPVCKWSDLGGPDPDLWRRMLEKGVLTREQAAKDMRHYLCCRPYPEVTPRHLELAVYLRVIDKAVANERLRTRFWTIYEWILSDLSWGKKLPDERLALERAVCEVNLR